MDGIASGGITAKFLLNKSSMKPASIAIVLLLTALTVAAAPGPFTLNGSAFCSSRGPDRPGIRLTWNASANATYYDVFENGGAIADHLPAAQGGYTFEQSDNGMQIGQTIPYYVVAHDNTGAYKSKSVDIFIPGNVCQPAPSAPVLDGSATCDPTGPRGIVNLTWSTSPTATSYVITRNSSSSPFPVTTTSTMYTDTSVTAGQSYTYKVTAMNSGGSAESNPKVISVPGSICPPTPPSATASAFCGAGPPSAPAVRVEWTSSQFASSYLVKRDGVAVSGAIPTSVNSFEDFSGVAAGQTYNYTVVATNDTASTTSPNAPVTIAGLGCIPPGTFSASVTEICKSGSPSAHVTWTASSDATSYNVSRDGVPYSGTLSSTTTTYDDQSVAAGHSYSYTVHAIGSGGTATNAAPASIAITTCGSGGNGAPDPFSASVAAFCNAGSPAVRVSWAAGSGATSYVVRRNGVDVSPSLSSTTLSFDDTSAPVNQNATYTVTGSNAAGTMTVQAGTVIPQATNCPPPAFTLTASATCNPIVSPPAAMVTLDWSAASVTTSYFIFRDTVQIGSVAGGTTTFNDSSATAAGTYTYVVRASGPGGNTDSNAATVTVLANLCGTPRPDLAAMDISAPPGAAQPGDTFPVAITVSNAADNAAAPATTSRIRIGTGTTVSPSDPIVAAIATPPLARGASTTQMATVTIPNLPQGTYYLFLSVDDDHVAGDINPSNDVKRSTALTAQSPPCTLACSASVPAVAQAGIPVAFAIQRPPCVNDRAVWTFGDSASATSYSPAHSYATPGTFHWTLTLTATTGESCSSSGNITVTAPTVPPKRRAVHH
jgi:fibronectin type 3 domain-containing protein